VALLHDEGGGVTVIDVVAFAPGAEVDGRLGGATICVAIPVEIA
jgi:hypothetical protein